MNAKASMLDYPTCLIVGTRCGKDTTMTYEPRAMSYVFNGGLVSAWAVCRSTNKTTQPAKDDFCAHPGHVWMLPRLRTSANGKPTTIASTALRPRSMPNTDWHSGQFHFAHGQLCRVQLTGSPQCGHFLLPRLYNGGLKRAILAPPRVSRLYHLGHYRSTSPMNHELSAMSYEL
jgi:hypothetical protein